jgi:hypothetical protein
MAEQPIGDGLVEAGPTEAQVLFGIAAEAFSPVGGVTEAVDVLRAVLKGEIDQGIGFPVARRDLPDRGLVGVEVPLAGRTDALPVDTQPASIAQILPDRAGGLDGHHRDSVAPGFKGQTMLLDVGGLDGDALAHAHAAHLGSDAVVVEAVLPDPFIDEAVGLVAAVDHGADEPAGGGGLDGVELWWGGIHTRKSLRIDDKRPGILIINSFTA